MSLTAELTAKLRDLILSGQMTPGQKLPTEQELVESMGVSRTVVREAIASLKSEELVFTRQGVGAFVAERIKPRPFEINQEELESIEDAVMILELRMAVEIGMAAAAAQRRTQKHLDEMWRQYNALSAAIEKGKDGTESDFALHRAIAEASENPYFVRFMDFLGSRIIPPRNVALSDTRKENQEKYLIRIQREHNRIIEAIAKQDASAASAAMRAHLGKSITRHSERLAAIRDKS